MLDFREPVRFEEVMFFTRLAEHGTYLSPLAVQAVADMAATIPPGGYRKLFVRRVPGWRRGRELVNEAGRIWAFDRERFPVLEVQETVAE